MKKKIFLSCLAFFLSMFPCQVWSAPLLVDWMFNDGGVIYSSASTGTAGLPGYIDTSLFNWNTGLGEISVSYNSIGMHSFFAFFDHEVSEGANTFYNEYGEVYSTPSPGQSWEIDEPGWVFGDIYDNTLAGQLDNTNNVPIGMEDDVSLAMGWEFSLTAGETALLTLTLSEDIPSGFYLAHVDPSGTHYFSGTLDIQSGPAPVPEPATVLLFSTGLIGIASLRRRGIY